MVLPASGKSATSIAATKKWTIFVIAAIIIVAAILSVAAKAADTEQ